MRTRTRLLTVFLGAYLVLAVATGLVAWVLLDGVLSRQALERARAVAGLGTWLSNDHIRSTMEELTAYRIDIVDGPVAAASGTVVVSDRVARSIVVHYHNDDYHGLRRLVLGGTIAVICAGVLAYGILAWLSARAFARPLEILAGRLRALGGGELAAPIPPVGDGEVRDLASDVEAMRQRLLELDGLHRRDERLRTLGTFTATIAHEVRNPLSAVQLALQLLGRRLPDDEQIAMARSELVRLDLIVDELLAFSRGITIEPVACDLRAVVEEVVDLLKRQAEHAGVTVAIEGAGTVRADANRLKQVLLNLVLNAIQAQHGGGAVTIDLADDGFTVVDQGPGVDEAMRDRLFDAFSTDKPAGTGLGLHIAKAITDAHQAYLVYEPGEPGSRFVLSGLPTVSAHDRDRPLR